MSVRTQNDLVKIGLDGMLLEETARVMKDNIYTKLSLGKFKYILSIHKIYLSFREIIESELKERRPNLSVSSLTTYVSILYNLKNKLDGEDSLKFFEEGEKILDFLKDKEPQTRKTSLSALFVLTGKSSYNELMLTDCKHTNEIYKQQQKVRSKRRGG